MTAPDHRRIRSKDLLHRRGHPHMTRWSVLSGWWVPVRVKQALAAISAWHQQSASVGFAVSAGAEALGLWLEPGSQASLLRVNGDASEGAGKAKLAPFQGADRLG